MAHTPITLHPAAADRIAAIIMLLEAAPAPEIGLTPLGVLHGATVSAHIILRLPDGGREDLTPEDARTLASCLWSDPSYPGAQDHGRVLWKAADEAEQRASSAVLNRPTGGAPAGWRRVLPFARRAARCPPPSAS